MTTTNPKTRPMTHEFIARLSGAEINRLALGISAQIVAKARGIKDCQKISYYLDDSYNDRFVLALVIHDIFWEIKDHGNIKTHPEDLLSKAIYNFPHSFYRAYHNGYACGLTFLCRAFARQFDDFDNFPRREINHFNWDGEYWEFNGSYEASCKWGFAGRYFSVEPIYTHDEFGKNKDFLGYYVCESRRGIFKFLDIDGKPDWIHIDDNYTIVPCISRDEAIFFLIQLVDMLNTGAKPRLIEGVKHYVDTDEKDYISQAAAQWIRDTLAQAPVEETRMREEEEAKARAEQLERERIAAEKARIDAEKRAQREKELSKGGYRVYVLQLEFNIIKIGISSNVLRRTPEIEGGGLKILKCRCTQPMTKGEARKIEQACHHHFRDRRKQREYFYVPYEEGCDKVQTFVDQPLIEVQLPDNS